MTPAVGSGSVRGELLLGFDIGTSSSKGALVRPDGEVVASAQREHDISVPRPGLAEQDADSVWWGDFVSICGELLPSAADGIAAVCASGLGPCLLAADEGCRALRPAMLYGIDTRAGREIEELTERYGAERILERSGSPLTAQAVGPKLAWLRRNEPEVWARTRRLLMASSFTVKRLTGEYVLDHHSASQCDPLYDLAAHAWAEDWAEEIAPGLPLPRLLWPYEVAGEVTAEAAAETGIPAGTPVAAGTIDTRAEAASVEVTQPGEAMIQYGTTVFMMEVLAAPCSDPHLWGTAGVTPDTYDLAAGMASGGALADWLHEVVHDEPFDMLLAEAARVPPGADGLVGLPYFQGERTPLFDPMARGAILGLTLGHERAHLYRALLESVAYGVRHNLDTIRAARARALGHGDTMEEEAPLAATGGGTTGRLWVQIVSDVIGRPQRLFRETLGACYGDAGFAGRAAGLFEDEPGWNSVVEEIHPDPSVREVYDRLYSIYLELYPATRDQAHALARLQAERPTSG